MNKNHIVKSCEICNRIGQELNKIPHTATFYPELRPLAKDYLIGMRHLVRDALKTIEIWDKVIRLFKRALQHTIVIDDIVTLSNAIKEGNEYISENRKALVDYGYKIHTVMDWWQEFGADYPELFELCGADVTKVIAEYGKDMLPEKPTFSHMIFVYSLDYRGIGDFINEDYDGPFTHALLAYYRNFIVTEGTAGLFDKFFNETKTEEK